MAEPQEAPSPALMAEITRDLGQIRETRRRRLGLFCLAALGATLGFGFARGLQAPGSTHWLFWACLAAFGGGGLLLCAFAFGWLVPPRSRLRPLPWAGLAAGLLALGLTIRPEAAPAPFFHGVVCLSTGLGAVVVLLILALAFGGRFLRRHAPTGLLLGIGAGLLGIMPLHIACEHTSAEHLMVWHALVPILGGLFGALAWLALVPETPDLPRAVAKQSEGGKT